MTYDNTDEITEKLFDSLLSKYQIGLETQMRKKDLIFVLIYFITNVIKEFLNVVVHLLSLTYKLKSHEKLYKNKDFCGINCQPQKIY